MSAPSTSQGTPRRFTNNNKGGGNQAKNKSQNLKYGTPLPILLPPSPLHPAYVPPPPRFNPSQSKHATSSNPGQTTKNTDSLKTAIKHAKYKFASPEFPTCEGTLDEYTQSVWITSSSSRQILFNRGFFGKGSLSRSDPSWHTRRIKVVLAERQAEKEAAEAERGGDGGEGGGGGKKERGLTSEEVTALRRKERKQFKIDRAQAILDASLAAEKVLMGSSVAGSTMGESSMTQTTDGSVSMMEDEPIAGPSNPLKRINSTTSSIGTNATNTTSSAYLPSSSLPTFEEYAHVLPEGTTRLTPQTFLVRPTRPSVRVGPKGPRPPVKPTAENGSSLLGVGGGVDNGKTVTFADENKPGSDSAEAEAAVALALFEAEAENTRRALYKAEQDRLRQEEKDLEDEVEDMEHLQLTLEEAFFLSWALGCLVITDPSTNTTLPPLSLLHRIYTLPNQALKSPSLSLELDSKDMMIKRPDHPFLVNYAAYHHYRSLGWVVKTGIKFCVDYLLYKKGLVFSHAEFALLVIPHYMKDEDRESCPFILPNSEPMTWQWLNTVNRVNTQVKKTLILVYVMIPPMESLEPKDWQSPERLFSKFAVREVTIRRFVAARLRD